MSVTPLPRQHEKLKGFAAIAVLLGLAVALAYAFGGVPETGAATVAQGPSSSARPATGKFLIATEQLADPNFSQSVILLIEYGEAGALGVIVNRPTGHKLATMFPEVERLRDRKEVVNFGGPVQLERLLLLIHSERSYEGARQVLSDIQVTASTALFDKLLEEEGDKLEFRFFAGYAGWAPGQLEAEIARGDWLLSSADAGQVFSSDPSKLWPSLMRGKTGQWARAPGQAAPRA